MNFGKFLAHTDKLVSELVRPHCKAVETAEKHLPRVVRDRGFKRLKRWLVKHPELERPFVDTAVHLIFHVLIRRLEYMKVWKGLYFAVWMADKRPVQQDLCSPEIRFRRSRFCACVCEREPS